MVVDVQQTFLNYVNLIIDNQKGTFVIEEALDLPEGYNYGYYLLDEEENWKEDGKEFDGTIINKQDIGNEISGEGKSQVVICIVKDGILVRSLIGDSFRTN